MKPIFYRCFFLLTLIICSQVKVQAQTKTSDATTESKVDYLEQIYFSGKNKDSLYVMILKTVQKLDGKPATYAVAKQYVFLTGIEQAAQSADNACQIEETLAQGIYSIDVDEATRQGIPLPNNKSKDDAAKALASINDFGNSTQNLAYNSWQLHGDHISPYGYYYYSGYSPTESSIATKGYQISALASTVGTGMAMTQEAKSALKYLHLSKDKPCKNVHAKAIEIGEHAVPDTNSTTIVINNINAMQLSSMAATLEKIPGFTSVNSDKFDNNVATLFIQANKMKIQEIIDKVTRSSRALKFNIENRSSNGATLSVKP